MSGDLHFDGDPATDSARRHMERVLKGEPTRKWPWIVAALGGGGLWMLFRMGGDAARNRTPSSSEDKTGSPETSVPTTETLASRR
jgi:hypothetical protein